MLLSAAVNPGPPQEEPVCAILHDLLHANHKSPRCKARDSGVVQQLLQQGHAPSSVPHWLSLACGLACGYATALLCLFYRFLRCALFNNSSSSSSSSNSK